MVFITKFYGLLGILLIGITSACQNADLNSQESFLEKPKVLSQEILPYQLARARELSHKFVRSKHESGKSWFDSYSLNIQFPALTRSEFDYLKKTYGGWSRQSSQIIFQEGASYQLTDFLPPPMGAVLENVFVQEDVIQNLPQFNAVQSGFFSKRVDQRVSLLTNCWGTVYEIMRWARSDQPPAQGDFYFFYAPENLARYFFTDDRWTSMIKDFDDTVVEQSKTRNEHLEPGDILVIGKKYLQHVAIFIDDDLYFEKAGAGSTALYRLNDFQTIAKTWPADLHGYSWRRIKNQAFPSPEKLFNLQKSLPELSLDLFSATEMSNLTAEVDRDDQSRQIRKINYFATRAMKLRTSPRGIMSFSSESMKPNERSQ